MAGETTRLVPVPTALVPQPLAYHCHVPPVPRLPPLTVKVLLFPEQIALAEGLADAGAVDTALTLIVILEQSVVLQVPTPFTKYVVVDAGLTVIKFPVPAAVPEQVPVNHCQDAPVPRLPPLTVSVVVAPAHTVLPDEAVTEVGFELTELSVMAVETQPVFPHAPSALT